MTLEKIIILSVESNDDVGKKLQDHEKSVQKKEIENY